MYRYNVKRLCFIIVISISAALPAQSQPTVSLRNNTVRLAWSRTDDGYVLNSLKVKGLNGWNSIEPAKYQHNILYSSIKPDTKAQKLYDKAGKEINFPGSQYRYIIPSWQQNTSAVSLNLAGENMAFKPSGVNQISDMEIFFYFENEFMKVREKWSLDTIHQNDIKLTVTLQAKKEGYFSIATPSLALFDKYDFKWATIPGIFQGNSINTDFVRAYGYGQGIPDKPMVARERTASTLSAIITNNDGITLAVTAEPGMGRDPWPKDKKAHAEWRLGLSVMNRENEFSPTLYHPVLGETGSFVKAGDTISFSSRYTIRQDDWYTVFKHVVNDIYRFPDFLKLKKTNLSLTQRLYDMHNYLVNDSTSKWHTYNYKGLEIGAQDYLGGVYGSEKDAVKNSDYGAMWMLAKMTNDPRLTKDRLPYALNFKLAQQHSEKGFFYGAAAGQYYQTKSERFTEEWGPYTEPIATTYYMLMDIGNILLFEPRHKELKEHLRLSADKLLEWMKPNGQWEVGYNNVTTQSEFVDIKDLRPTFYGLLIAYQILKDEKYLQGAIKGADWYVNNGVEKGHFLGVCGDTRFVPDFATIQSVQALLSLYDITKDSKYKDAAIAAARIYTASVYTHPIPTTAEKEVKGIKRQDWEISEAGLSFEHGGVLGSANHRGPILLASHAGTFVRMYAMTQDSLFLNMARAAAIGRDAFVDQATGVASYYWDTMNNGAGPYPHHAWWQIGWITDYLLSEAELRSSGKISFPGGYITPKVGPHRPYGFMPGVVFGDNADLIMRQGLFTIGNPYIEYVTAINEKKKEVYLIMMNNDDEKQSFSLTIDMEHLYPHRKVKIENVKLVNDSGGQTPIDNNGSWNLTIDPYGLSVAKIQYKYE